MIHEGTRTRRREGELNRELGEFDAQRAVIPSSSRGPLEAGMRRTLRARLARLISGKSWRSFQDYSQFLNPKRCKLFNGDLFCIHRSGMNAEQRTRNSEHRTRLVWRKRLPIAVERLGGPSLRHVYTTRRLAQTTGASRVSGVPPGSRPKACATSLSRWWTRRRRRYSKN